MKRSRSLCFTADGLCNPEDLDYIEHNTNLTTVVLAGDGSDAAFEQIKSFQDHAVLKHQHIGRVMVTIPPKHEIRLKSADGKTTSPHFLYTSDDIAKWIAKNVVAPHLEIAIQDLASSTESVVKLDQDDVEALCYAADRLWNVLTLAEERLAFPAVVIDRLMPLTYNLTPQTIDIAKLRSVTGLNTLNYTADNRVLSVEVGGETFAISLDVMNSLYGECILPFVRPLLIRRVVLLVTIPHRRIENAPMTYGQIGMLISQMKDHVVSREIDDANPIEKDDLLEWAKRLPICDETCVWVERNESISQAVDKLTSKLVRSRNESHLEAHSHPESVSV